MVFTSEDLCSINLKSRVILKSQSQRLDSCYWLVKSVLTVVIVNIPTPVF